MSIATVHLNRILQPVVGCFTPEVAAKVAALRADEKLQQRIDFLAERANEGKLTSEETDEYESYVRAIDVIAILQAQARAVLRQAS